MSPVRNREVSESVLRTEMHTVISKGYTKRPIIILQGKRPSTVPDKLTVDDITVTVRECSSALAIYDAMYNEPQTHGLAIITDCDEEGLGNDILNYVVGHRVRKPKAWESLKNLFNSTSISNDLYTMDHADAVAEGLLAVLPTDPNPEASDTVNATRAFTAVAQSCLGITTPSSAREILIWSRNHNAASLVKQLAQQGKSALQKAYLDWQKTTLGSRGLLINPIATVDAHKIHGLLPLCLATHILLQPTSAPSNPDSEDERALPEPVKLALAKLEHRWSVSGSPERETLRLVGNDAKDLIHTMLLSENQRAEACTILTETDALLNEVAEVHTYQHSTLSPAAWNQQVRQCAQAAATDTTNVETAWQACTQHVLATIESETSTALHSAVRLNRWLHTHRSDHAPTNLAEATQRQININAWVDTATNIVHHGSTDTNVSAAYAHLLNNVAAIRDQHDREFAHYLTKHGATSADLNNRGLLGVENLINDVLLPLTAAKPTLLLILDGMSGAAAVTIADDMQHKNWHELTPNGSARRQAALSVLPSLTEHSRTSLLCGALTSGDSSKEKTGFRDATHKYHGIAFHKRDFRDVNAGEKLSSTVNRAIADTDKHRTVACVLNAIDDSLDKGNPSRTRWNTTNVDYLAEVLRAARAAGRVVIITADHGHILERPRTKFVATPEATSARSKPFSDNPTDTETLVTGDRVLPHDETGTGQAILAVHEGLRYASGKEGYHGGASPAEVVVPVMVFDQVTDVNPTTESPWGTFDIAPPLHPKWWLTARHIPEADQSSHITSPGAQKTTPTAQVSNRRHKPVPENQGSLFDQQASAVPKGTVPSAPQPLTGTKTTASLGIRITKSATYKALPESTRNRAQVQDRLVALVDALDQAPSNRLPKQHIAQELNLALPRLTGALSTIESLLNVEGYQILMIEDDIVILDVPLLREQFELPKS